MDVLEILGAEHRLIAQFLDTAGFVVRRLSRGERPPTAYFEEALRFADEFIDRYHHPKEEERLFPLLVQRREQELEGRIDVLWYQHDRARHHLSQIASALARHPTQGPDLTTLLLESLAAYVALMQRHIYEEDAVVFAEARKLLTTEERASLAEVFDRADERAGLDYAEHALERVERLSMLAATREENEDAA